MVETRDRVYWAPTGAGLRRFNQLGIAEQPLGRAAPASQALNSRSSDRTLAPGSKKKRDTRGIPQARIRLINM
jgi:hypothetical protein